MNQTAAKGDAFSASSRMNLGRTRIDKVIAQRFNVHCLLDDGQDALRMRLDEADRARGYSPLQREQIKQALGHGGHDAFSASPSSQEAK